MKCPVIIDRNYPLFKIINAKNTFRSIAYKTARNAIIKFISTGIVYSVNSIIKIISIGFSISAQLRRWFSAIRTFFAGYFSNLTFGKIPRISSYLGFVFYAIKHNIKRRLPYGPLVRTSTTFSPPCSHTCPTSYEFISAIANTFPICTSPFCVICGNYNKPSMSISDFVNDFYHKLHSFYIYPSYPTNINTGLEL